MSMAERTYGQVFHDKYREIGAKAKHEFGNITPWDEVPEIQDACDMAASVVIAEFLDRRAAEEFHLSGPTDHGTACGRKGRTLSRHEVARFRVQCSECLEIERLNQIQRAQRTGCQQ